MRGELTEVIHHIVGIAIETSHERREKILHAPSCHYSIETQDDGRGKDAQIAYEFPPFAASQLTIGSCGIGRSATAYDKLADHARNTQHENTDEINQDKGRTAIMTGHIRETPNVA